MIIKKISAGITGQVTFDNTRLLALEILSPATRLFEEMVAINHEKQQSTITWRERVRREVEA